MIARVTEGDREAFAALLQRDPLFGGRIATAFDCWGEHPRACGFYRAGRSAALLVQGGGALLCGRQEAAEAEELAAFLRFAGVERLCSRGICPPGWQQRALVEMELRQPPAADGAAGPDPFLPQGAHLERQPSLWRLRESGLLEGADPDGWYADACARRARGLALIWTVERDGVPLSTAGLYSLRPDGAYLTAVATRPGARGHGYAAALVLGLSRTCGGRPVRLLCGEPLRGFYEKLGFAASGTAVEAVCPPGDAAARHR